jgi:hypothetical protein
MPNVKVLLPNSNFQQNKNKTSSSLLECSSKYGYFVAGSCSGKDSPSLSAELAQVDVFLIQVLYLVKLPSCVQKYTLLQRQKLFHLVKLFQWI